MSVTKQGKIGNCVHTSQIRTGKHEKIAQHAVRVPVRRKITQTIKQVATTLAMLMNNGMYFKNKIFKTLLWVHTISSAGLVFPEQKLMPGKPDINERNIIKFTISLIGQNKPEILVYAINLPYYVVPGSETVNSFIKAWKSRTEVIIIHYFLLKLK
jgi:hypothetical protein